MAEPSEVNAAASDVPTQVFEKFLSALATDGIPDDVITRLRVALIEKKTFNDRALKTAVLNEEPPP